jgi:hypothetical protein
LKVKKEELMKEEDIIKTEEIEKEKIKKEEDVESSFRAGLSRFAYPSSPPSARRRPPKRPAPVSDSTASLTVTVAVAQPTPVTVRQDASESNNDGPDSVDSGAVQAQQALRRSPRNLKRKGDTRTSLDTGIDGGSHGGTRPPSKKKRRVNPRAQDVDLSHLPNLGALPEYLAEDLDGTLLLTLFMHAAFPGFYIK